MVKFSSKDVFMFGWLQWEDHYIFGFPRVGVVEFFLLWWESFWSWFCFLQWKCQIHGFPLQFVVCFWFPSTHVSLLLFLVMERKSKPHIWLFLVQRFLEFEAVNGTQTHSLHIVNWRSYSLNVSAAASLAVFQSLRCCRLSNSLLEVETWLDPITSKPVCFADWAIESSYARAFSSFSFRCWLLIVKSKSSVSNPNTPQLSAAAYCSELMLCTASALFS